MTEIVLLLASPLHRYEGRPKDGPVPFDGRELVEAIEVRAGLGIVGDRFFGQRAHVLEAVTLLAAESLEAVALDLGVATLDPARTRRNIVTRGIDIDAMHDATFTLDSGDGPVRFRGNRPARPCAWMDEQLAPGAFRALRGRSGIRCEAIGDGTLRLGPVTLVIE